MAGESFSSIVIPDWFYDWISPRKGTTGSKTGFQKAHMVGDDFWGNLPEAAKDAFAELEQFGIGANYTSNAELLPETQRGGAVLQSSTHSGPHVAELNTAQYDVGGNRPTPLSCCGRYFI